VVFRAEPLLEKQWDTVAAMDQGSAGDVGLSINLLSESERCVRRSAARFFPARAAAIFATSSLAVLEGTATKGHTA